MTEPRRPKLIQRSEDTRGDARHAVTVSATCQVGERPVEDVLVTDLSPSGCRVRLVTIGVTRSERVQLWLGAEGPVAAKLTWVKQGSLGVAFDTPLDTAAVERLNGQTLPANVVPLRRSERG